MPVSLVGAVPGLRLLLPVAQPGAGPIRGLGALPAPQSTG